MTSIKVGTTTLTYPLYACDFDPQDASRLVVGGGGGQGTKSGVSNTISLLDASSTDHPKAEGNKEGGLKLRAELESSLEDAVMSLAVGPRKGKGKGSVVYAGVNSSPEDLRKGKNEHFRTFSLDSASKGKAGPAAKIQELSRASVFTSTEGDTYQRIVRLSPDFGGSAQLGAVATGQFGAKNPQIALFDVAADGKHKQRGILETEKEAKDLDLTQTGDAAYQLAYCDEYDLYLMHVAEGDAQEPQNIYTTPHDEATGAARPSFRCLRFLTPTFLLAVANLPKAGGVVLQGFRLPQVETGGKARLAVSASLPRHVKQAALLAVRNLAPVPSPTTSQGDTQFVIAVAGQDSSISIYTVDYQKVQTVDVLVNLHQVQTLSGVHESQITCLALSAAPGPGPGPGPQQHVKLASVDFVSHVACHWIPLRKHVEKATAAAAEAARRGGPPPPPPPPPRHVVALRGRSPSLAAHLVFSALLVALIAVLAQGFLEVKGISPSLVGARHVVPASWHRAPPPPRTGAAAGPNDGFLARFLAERKLSGDERIVLREDDTVGAGAGGETERQEQGQGQGQGGGVRPIQAVVHDEASHGGSARPWEELAPEQREAWRERLKRTGHWAEDMGETIFKGILFAELGGAVQHMLA